MFAIAGHRAELKLLTRVMRVVDILDHILTTIEDVRRQSQKLEFAPNSRGIKGSGHIVISLDWLRGD